MGNEAFSEWNLTCGRQSRRLANTPPYGKEGFARSRKRVGFKAFCGFSERHSTAQQSPFGAVREANYLERAPLCRQFLKKASYSRHSPLLPQPEPFLTRWHGFPDTISAKAHLPRKGPVISCGPPGGRAIGGLSVRPAKHRKYRQYG